MSSIINRILYFTFYVALISQISASSIVDKDEFSRVLTHQEILDFRSSMNEEIQEELGLKKTKYHALAILSLIKKWLATDTSLPSLENLYTKLNLNREKYLTSAAEAILAGRGFINGVTTNAVLTNDEMLSYQQDVSGIGRYIQNSSKKPELRDLHYDKNADDGLLQNHIDAVHKYLHASDNPQHPKFNFENEFNDQATYVERTYSNKTNEFKTLKSKQREAFVKQAKLLPNADYDLISDLVQNGGGTLVVGNANELYWKIHDDKSIKLMIFRYLSSLSKDDQEIFVNQFTTLGNIDRLFFLHSSITKEIIELTPEQRKLYLKQANELPRIYDVLGAYLILGFVKEPLKQWDSFAKLANELTGDVERSEFSRMIRTLASIGHEEKLSDKELNKRREKFVKQANLLVQPLKKRRPSNCSEAIEILSRLNHEQWENFVEQARLLTDGYDDNVIYGQQYVIILHYLAYANPYREKINRGYIPMETEISKLVPLTSEQRETLVQQLLILNTDLGTIKERANNVHNEAPTYLKDRIKKEHEEITKYDNYYVPNGAYMGEIITPFLNMTLEERAEFIHQVENLTDLDHVAYSRFFAVNRLLSLSATQRKEFVKKNKFATPEHLAETDFKEKQRFIQRLEWDASQKLNEMTFEEQTDFNSILHQLTGNDYVDERFFFLNQFLSLDIDNRKKFVKEFKNQLTK